MNLKNIAVGRHVPDDVNAVIEVPQGSSVKYELDKPSGVILVDRFLFTAMHYPANYGFIPHTLSTDGDPTDILVVSPQPVQAGAIMRTRPIGVLLMEDEHSTDCKIIAVPHHEVAGGYDHIEDIGDLPSYLREEIFHFFGHYKELEQGKWVRLQGWQGAGDARAMILADLARANATHA